MKLTAQKICKKFNRKTNGASWFYAVQGTDFTLQENALTAIYGRSGGGKTTLLNMLGGIQKPEFRRHSAGEHSAVGADGFGKRAAAAAAVRQAQ